MNIKSLLSSFAGIALTLMPLLVHAQVLPVPSGQQGQFPSIDSALSHRPRTRQTPGKYLGANNDLTGRVNGPTVDVSATGTSAYIATSELSVISAKVGNYSESSPGVETPGNAPFLCRVGFEYPSSRYGSTRSGTKAQAFWPSGSATTQLDPGGEAVATAALHVPGPAAFVVSAVTSASSFTITVPGGASFQLPLPEAYDVIKFNTGADSGCTGNIQSYTSGVVVPNAALPNAPAVGDTGTLYRTVFVNQWQSKVPLFTGIATSITSTTAVLPYTASSVDGSYVGNQFYTVGSSPYGGAAGVISAYVGSTRTVTYAALTAPGTNTQQVTIFPNDNSTFSYTRYANNALGETSNQPAVNSSTTAGYDLTGPGSFEEGVHSGQFLMCPVAVYGNNDNDVSVCLFGDSIEQGQGTSASTLGYSQLGLYGPPPAVPGGFQSNLIPGPGIPFVNASVGGSTINQFLYNLYPASHRLQLAQNADYTLTDLGINDVTAGRTATQMYADMISLSGILALNGARIIPQTVTPKTSSTDYWITTTNQTINGNDSARTGYNTSLRGATTGITQPFFTVFDAASMVEANSSNALTQGGGYWLAPSAAFSTGNVIASTSTTTVLQVAAIPTPSYLLGNLVYGEVIQMTSGAASGQIRQVTSASATTLTVSSAFSAAPAGGDTYSIWHPYTFDGTHLSIWGHALVGIGQLQDGTAATLPAQLGGLKGQIVSLLKSFQ